MEIKDGLIKEALIIDDFMSEDTLLVAPQEFTALLVMHFDAIRSRDVATYESSLLLIDKWLSDENNAKRICIIKNIGK